jgi:putative acetyltransferase
MQIRQETAGDAGGIEALILAAFRDHPHHAPGEGTTEHLIVQRLREAGALRLSLVAEDEGGAIVGHVGFSPITVDGQPLHWLAMAPVSVSPACQRQGIGGQLIRQALALLQEQAAEGAVVLGDPGYYTRFGFHHAHSLVVPGVPAEYFMAQTLQDHATLPQGTVGFHPAFG